MSPELEPIISLASDAKYQSKTCFLALMMSVLLPWTVVALSGKAAVVDISLAIVDLRRRNGVRILFTTTCAAVI